MMKIFSMDFYVTRRDKILKALKAVLCLLLAAGFAMNLLQAITYLSPSGDEGFFLKEVSRFRTDGLWNSFAAGISHLHVVLVTALAALVSSPLLAGRLLNVMLLVLALILVRMIIRNMKLKRPVELVTIATFAYMLVFTQLGKTFYRFINDPLMIVLALCSVYLFQMYFSKDRIWYFIGAGISSGMMFWVRSFSLLIWAGMLAFLVLDVVIRKPHLKRFLHMLLFVFISVSVAMLVQIPSISQTGRLSYESKGADGDWGDRNWVTRHMRKSNGGIFSYQRAEWREVEQFKQDFGDDSIPQSLTSMIGRDPKFVADNFVSNLMIRVPYVMFSSIGIFFFIFLDLLRRPRWLLGKNSSQPRLLFLLVAASVCLGVSLVIINYVEQRWLMAPVACVLFLAAAHLDQRVAPRWINALLAAQIVFLVLTGVGSLAKFLF